VELSADFALIYNFQGTHILGASRGHLCDSMASCFFLHNFNKQEYVPWNAVYRFHWPAKMSLTTLKMQKTKPYVRIRGDFEARCQLFQ